MSDSEPNSTPESAKESAKESAGESARVSRLIRVRGRVQGVFYRASAQMRARELGIFGYARNLTDGSVEVLAHGTTDAVEIFTQWLWTGSPASRVTAVDSTPHEPAADYRPADFTTA